MKVSKYSYFAGLLLILSSCAAPPPPHPSLGEKVHHHHKDGSCASGACCGDEKKEGASCGEEKGCDCSQGTSCGEHMGCSAAATGGDTTTSVAHGHSSTEALAKLKTLTSVGPQHALLKQLIGTWKTEVKLWESPSSAPLVSKGVSISRSLFDGRFIEEMFKGTHAKEPYYGRGLIGFDNLSKTYVSTWIDSLSTDINLGRGMYNEATKSLVFETDVANPMNGTKAKIRSLLEFIDNKTHIYRSFVVKANGEEIKTMEVTYTRK